MCVCVGISAATTTGAGRSTLEQGGTSRSWVVDFPREAFIIRSRVELPSWPSFFFQFSSCVTLDLPSHSRLGGGEGGRLLHHYLKSAIHYCLLAFFFFFFSHPHCSLSLSLWWDCEHFPNIFFPCRQAKNLKNKKKKQKWGNWIKKSIKDGGEQHDGGSLTNQFFFTNKPHPLFFIFMFWFGNFYFLLFLLCGGAPSPAFVSSFFPLREEGIKWRRDE